jgi:hypothetical protein
MTIPSQNVVAFKEHGQNTLVQTLVSSPKLADLETVINMGMKERLTSTLDDLLLELQK